MKHNVIFSPAGVEIILSPFLVGEPLEKKAAECSGDFVSWYLKEKIPLIEPVCHLDVLRGGHYYFFEDTLKALPMKSGKAEMRANRFQDKETGKWDVEIKDIHAGCCETLIASNTIFIGDTVATGSTLAGVLRWVLKIRAEAGVKTAPAVHLFTICGGDLALERLQSVTDEYAALGGSIDITFANAIFKLASNGTDLMFEHAKWEPRALKIVNEQLAAEGGDSEANLRARKAMMKCACWDWGERFYSLESQAVHLKEVSHHYRSMENMSGGVGPLSHVIRGLMSSSKSVEDGLAQLATASSPQ